MASRLRIQKDLELSATPRSLLITDGVNEPAYTAPGTAGQVLTMVSGVPTWAASPADVLTTIAYNGTTGVLSYVDEAGATTNINLPLEKFLSSASLNSTTNILTLTLNDGSTVTVNMTDYLGYTFDIADTTGGLETVGVSDTINFIGNNGFNITVTAGNDVTLVPPVGSVTGQVLTWDNGAGEWTVSTPATGSFTLAGNSGTNNVIASGDTATIVGSRGFTTVSSATDTLTITPPLGTVTGQVMTWNNTTSVWEPTTPAAGSSFTLAGNSGTSNLISAGDTASILATRGFTTVASATDTVTVTPPSGTVTGQVMTWDNTAGTWSASTPAGTFTVAGTAGTNQTITLGTDTLTLTGLANGIQITGSATDTMTFALREQVDTTTSLTSGTTVTATQTPIAATLRVYRNGLIKDLTTDYTLSGSTVTFTTAFGISGGAQGGETVKLEYRF
jgi:hypothetical protein